MSKWYSSIVREHHLKLIFTADEYFGENQLKEDLSSQSTNDFVRCAVENMQQNTCSLGARTVKHKGDFCIDIFKDYCEFNFSDFQL